MIITLEKELEQMVRRILGGDDLFNIVREVLKSYCPEQTTLTPTSIYVSGLNLVDVILNLPDVEAGIDDELDDLEDEAEGDNDAMLVMSMALLVIVASTDRNAEIDTKGIGKVLLKRCKQHRLWQSMAPKLDQAERHRRDKGHPVDLKTYAPTDVSQLTCDKGLERYIQYTAEHITENVDAQLATLTRYNEANNGRYQRLVNLLSKAERKWNVNGDYVAHKHIDYNVEHVAEGATGFNIQK